jgi:hypothetical protein
LRRKLFRQSFEQRFGQRILYFSESPKVPLRHRDTPVKDRRPGYQRRGTARDERDGDDTSPAWRRSSDQEKCRQPEKRVPCGIAEGRTPDPETDQRCDERDPHAQEQAPVARFFLRAGPQARSGEHDYGAGGQGQDYLPGSPQLGRHTVQWRGDATAQVGEKRRSRTEQDHTDNTLPVLPRSATTPEPDSGEQEQ